MGRPPIRSMRTEVVRTALSFLAGTGLGIALTWRFLQADQYDGSEEESDEEADDEETYKMLLIVNMELYRTSSKDPTKIKKVKMSAGKAAAQASHATLGAYRRAVKQCPRSVSTWLNGQMKITVKCPTVEELLSLEQQCISAGLVTSLIRDAGHTEIDPGSRTVLAVGPAPARVLDHITRHLKPY